MADSDRRNGYQTTPNPPIAQGVDEQAMTRPGDSGRRLSHGVFYPISQMQNRLHNGVDRHPEILEAMYAELAKQYENEIPKGAHKEGYAGQMALTLDEKEIICKQLMCDGKFQLAIATDSQGQLQAIFDGRLDDLRQSRRLATAPHVSERSMHGVKEHCGTIGTPALAQHTGEGRQ